MKKMVNKKCGKNIKRQIKFGKETSIKYFC